MTHDTAAADTVRTPIIALVLGYAGLLPFLSLAVIATLSDQAVLAGQLLVAYSAIILSFLGGIRWGLTAVRAQPTLGQRTLGRDLVLAICLSLLAFAALAHLIAKSSNVASVVASIQLLLMGHLLALALDALLPSTMQPRWLGRLRLRLSFGVIVCHAIAWWGLGGL